MSDTASVRPLAIVTGAARGIGLACAQALARAGDDLALIDLDPAVDDAVTAVASAGGVTARAYRTDVADPAAVEQIVATIARDFGRIDHLVNNAGVQFVSPIVDFPIERWQRVRAIDLDSVFYFTKFVWPHLRAAGGGRIVNIASVHGLVASPFKAAYVASKFGVVGFTKAAAVEGASENILVNAICPGVVLTDLIKNQAESLAASYGGGISNDEALRRAFLEQMPTQRFIDPGEVGSLCAYLCGDAARSITGAALSLDGGWAAH